MRSHRAFLANLPLMAAFAAHAITVGSLFSRIAEIQQALALTEAAYGLTLMGLAAGVFVGSPLVSTYVDRIGPRAILLWGLPVFAATPNLAAYAFGAWSLFFAMFAAGVTLAIGNVAMNVEADRVEAATGRRVMNKCHGVWGLGYLLITLLGAAAIAAGIGPALHFALLFGGTVLMSLLLVRPMKASPPRRASRPARPFAMPTVAILLILGFALSGTWLEGATRTWSIIYLRDAFAEPEWRAALSLPVIITAQTAGRFLADGWIARHGAMTVARALSAMSLAGLVLIVFAGSTYLAFFGLALIGLGVSTVYPQSLSAAAQLGDRPASENVAALSSLQTVVVFVGPPIFGFVAAEFGQRAAFGLLLPLPLMAIVFARFVGQR